VHVPDVFYIRLNGLELQTERILDPSLRNRPVAIISSYDSKGTIVSLSKEAEDDGLSYGMKISMAKRISQSTRFLPYNWPLYSKINQYILQTISDFTPTIEQNGFDGFYLDMKGIDILSGHIHNSGLSIFNRIQDKTSIISSVGISINKLISRTITSVVPEKVHNVETGLEAEFLAPLNPIILPVIREKNVYRIIKFLIIKRIFDIQVLKNKTENFQLLFNKYSQQLSRECMGVDISAVKPIEMQNNIICQSIIPKDTNDEKVIYATIKDLTEQIGFILRKRKKNAQEIKINIHYSDGHQSSCSGKLGFVDDKSIFDVLKLLFFRANKRRNRIRSILIDAYKLSTLTIQNNLFFDDKNMKISEVKDKIRQKYGLRSLHTVDVLQILRDI
tara:strand:+ start:578 stop:1744 length:1167 start_codon:yes stop_codon:yes gene_type:complete